MSSDWMHVDDRQLDEALRTIAAAPVPADLPTRVLDAIGDEARGGWHPIWRPVMGAIVLVAVVLGVIAASMRNDASREAQGSRHMAQGSETVHLGTLAPSAPSGPTRASQIVVRRMDPPPQRTVAPGRTPAPDEVPALDPPAPLTIARLEMAELSEREIQLHAIHIPRLEIKSLER